MLKPSRRKSLLTTKSRAFTRRLKCLPRFYWQNQGEVQYVTVIAREGVSSVQ